MTADGRFAPSPTGTLHLGNLRTALLAWLFARSQDARFLVRMEDLDTGRVRERFYDEQLADLAALGLDWDGPVVRQSERIELYERGARAPARRRPRLPVLVHARGDPRGGVGPARRAARGRLPGHLPRLTAAERAEREAAGRPPALRVRADAARVAFEDRVAGRFEGVVDDFVVRRNDGAFAYNLAVVVDDAEQGVARGRARRRPARTPRRASSGSARALGLAGPRHAHVPLVLGPDGERLAKRHGAVTLADRAALGAVRRPTCAASWRRRSGWRAAARRSTPAELVERFSVGRPARRRA